MLELDAYLSDVSQTLLCLSREQLAAISAALWATYSADGTIFICGNGGSAATASHFACDLSKWTISPDARRVRAVALTDNIALMTAWSNDQGYADVFVEQLTALYRPGDMVFAISGSGNSPNVLQAIRWGNTVGAETVGITGFDGGQLAKLARIALRVENSFMPQIEDAHAVICHALAVSLGRQIARMQEATTLTMPLQHTTAVLMERVVGNGGL